MGTIAVDPAMVPIFLCLPQPPAWHGLAFLVPGSPHIGRLFFLAYIANEKQRARPPV